MSVDLSREMLRAAEATGAAGAAEPDRLRGDLRRMPFADAAFGEVVLLGNSVGFAGGEGERLLDEAERVLEPGGWLLIETAPGPGERSRYLTRLPRTAVGRLFESPPKLVASRVDREGFEPQRPRHKERGFVRWTPEAIDARYGAKGWTVEERISVAPALGADPDRAAAAAESARAWQRLLELEELLGRRQARHRHAAALLTAVRRPPTDRAASSGI